MKRSATMTANQFNGGEYGKGILFGKVPGEKVYTGITIPNSQAQLPTKTLSTALGTEDHFDNLATEILSYLYPKFCPEHKIQLTKTISTRRYSVKCPKCRHQQSRFSYTPFHHMKLPTWMFGWAIYESIQRYPQVLSSREIQRRLKIAKNSALLLKRRLQLFATDQTPRIKELMQNELKEKFNGVMLPRVSENRNVNEVLQGKSVPQVDSVVLFSASQRANQGRKRHKHTGQTASIYMNDKLGGKQIGTLVHTLSWKGGPVIYDSISNNKGETLRPLLDEYIPKDVPVFSDEGYKWFYRINKNHRMVNHNRKSEDKRYKWARNRWCKDGVHNQVAEGNHRILKWNFTAGYGYITPEYSQLYLNEYSFWKNVKYYGWNKLIRTDEENRELLKQRKAIVNQVSEKENKIGSESIKCDTIGKKSPVESQREAKGVRGRSTGSERNRGQNNAVTAGNKKALDGARCDGGKGAGDSPVFRRNCGVESRQGRRPCAMPERGMVGILRRNYPQDSWLKKSLRNQKFKPLTLLERKAMDSNKETVQSLEQWTELLNQPGSELLRQAMQDYDAFSRSHKKHELEAQRIYERASNKLWQELIQGEWCDLDSIMRYAEISRAQAYRLIRVWATCGIAEVVDRTSKDGVKFQKLYDVRKRIEYLPPLKYILSRSGFRDFEKNYAKHIERHYKQRRSKAKYGN